MTECKNRPIGRPETSIVPVAASAASMRAAVERSLTGRLEQISATVRSPSISRIIRQRMPELPDILTSRRVRRMDVQPGCCSMIGSPGGR